MGQKNCILPLKFLGAMVVERLILKEHINLVCTKVARLFGVIRKICGLINQSCQLPSHFSLIYPHLTCCNIVWASTYCMPPTSVVFT